MGAPSTAALTNSKSQSAKTLRNSCCTQDSDKIKKYKICGKVCRLFSHIRHRLIYVGTLKCLVLQIFGGDKTKIHYKVVLCYIS